jgi:hypothetical protein
MASGRLLQRLAYALDVAFLGLLALLPRHAYEWMKDLDPGMNQLPDDPLRDVRLVVTLAALLVVAGVHAVNALWSEGVRWRVINGPIVCALTVLWAWKFLA